MSPNDTQREVVTTTPRVHPLILGFTLGRAGKGEDDRVTRLDEAQSCVQPYIVCIQNCSNDVEQRQRMAIRVNYLWKWLEKRLLGLGTMIIKHLYSRNIREKSSCRGLNVSNNYLICVRRQQQNLCFRNFHVQRIGASQDKHIIHERHAFLSIYTTRSTKTENRVKEGRKEVAKSSQCFNYLIEFSRVPSRSPSWREPTGFLVG